MEVDDLELAFPLSETRNHIPDVFLKVSSLIAIVLVAKDQNYELRVVINKLLEKMHLRQIRYRFPIFIDLFRSNLRFFFTLIEVSLLVSHVQNFNGGPAILV